MLSQNDLLKITDLFKIFKQELLDIFVTKKEFQELKDRMILLQDSVIGIKNTLNTEYELRYAKLEKVSSIVDDHENRLTCLEKDKIPEIK